MSDDAGATRFPALSNDSLLIWSGLLFVSAAALSNSDRVSMNLVIVATILGIKPVLARMRTTRPAQYATALAAAWMLYGLAVGSLPSPFDSWEVFRWSSTEGRALLALGALAVAASVSTVEVASTLIRRTCLMLSVTFIGGLAGHFLLIAPPGYVAHRRKLFWGYSSSHHVSGFLAAGVIIALLAHPRLVRPALRWPMIGLSLLVLGLSGSRSALVGLVAGSLVLFAHIFERRRFLRILGAVIVTAAIMLASVPRFRQTVQIVTRPEFVTEAIEAFDDGSTRGARQLSDSAVEANMLIRFALWGNQLSTFHRSPFLGYGRFRVNDFESERHLAGIPYVAEFRVGGEARFTQSQPHNLYVFLLAETGAIGLAAFAVPYVHAWRRTRRTGDADDPDDPGDPAPDAADPDDPVLEGAVLDSARLAGASSGGDAGAVPDGQYEASELDRWRGLSRGSLVMGAFVSLFSAGLLTTGLGLITNVLVFASYAAVLDLTPAPKPEHETAELVGADDAS